jgi:hypothetical protein
MTDLGMEKMKGITCCADCSYYNMKKHKCTRASDEGKPTDHFYADCPLPTVTKCSEWISVKDRLPEESGRYLVYAKEGERETHRTIAPFHKAFHLSGRMAYWKVTHWMPLPEPPKEET